MVGSVFSAFELGRRGHSEHPDQQNVAGVRVFWFMGPFPRKGQILFTFFLEYSWNPDASLGGIWRSSPGELKAFAYSPTGAPESQLQASG